MRVTSVSYFWNTYTWGWCYVFFFTVLKKHRVAQSKVKWQLRCELYGEYLGTIKCWECFDYLSSHKVLGSGYSLWSYSDKLTRQSCVILNTYGLVPHLRDPSCPRRLAFPQYKKNLVLAYWQWQTVKCLWIHVPHCTDLGDANIYY